jgi:hypothetical protein
MPPQAAGRVKTQRPDHQGRLLLCYISGLDLRRIGPHTPFLASALDLYPWTSFVNLPSNELFPTLVTGVDPTEHGVWGVKLRPLVPESGVARLLDRLPDRLVTTIQGYLHLATNAFDLAAVPPRRRRHFDITRTKYQRRNQRLEALFKIGGIASIFDVVGKEKSRYVFNSSSDPERQLLPRLCMDSHVLEVLELYSLDRYQQWNLDRPEAISRFYTRIDNFLYRLQAKCEASGSSMMIVCDHGHEPIRASIDLKTELARLHVPEQAYSYFIEVSNARFWFRTDHARQSIMTALSKLERATLLSFQDMHRFGVPLRDASYGEVFVFLDPGYIFFPHDFHHGLANLWLGLVDPMQRSRLRDPRHKGNHGHLPHFDTERSFVAFLDRNFEATTQRGSILDVAPSVLGVLDYEPPPNMKGQQLFRPRRIG